MVAPTMTPVGFSLLCIVATTYPLAAQSVEPTSTGKLSSRLASEIRSSLPKYEAPPPCAADKPETASPSPDADILVLPKVVVKERAQRRIIANELMTSKALDKKLAREFKNSLEGLDAILNGFSIPLISPSMAARGRDAYKARRMNDLNTFIESTNAIDPKASSEMKKAVNEMNDAEIWQGTAGRR